MVPKKDVLTTAFGVPWGVELGKRQGTCGGRKIKKPWKYVLNKRAIPPPGGGGGEKRWEYVTYVWLRFKSSLDPPGDPK